MALIKPVRAYLYNREKVDPISVISPPYDVINGEKYEELAKIPYNSIHLIKNRTFPPPNTWYDKVAETFERWLEEGVVKSDDEAIFVYRQRAEFNGRIVQRIGFIALLYTHEWKGSKIIPHERTYELPKRDRYALITRTGFQFEPIFCVFEDDGEVKNLLEGFRSNRFFISGKGPDDVEHTVWKVTERGFISEVARIMESKSVMIADGHHRFEVAKRIGEEFGKRDTEHPASYVLTFLSPFKGEYDSVFPIHRGIRKKISIDRIGEYFHLLELPLDESGWNIFFERTRDRRGRFVMYLGGKAFGGYLKEEINSDMDPVVCKLDVAVLHHFFIDELFESEEDMAMNMFYTPYSAEGVRKVDNGELSVFFILPPPDIRAIFKIAEQKKMLPHKSTYFYPKIPSGIVFYKIKGR